MVRDARRRERTMKTTADENIFENISERELRRLVRSSIAEATGDKREIVDETNFMELEVGGTYVVDGMPGKHEFVGWRDSDSGRSTSSDDPLEVDLQFLSVQGSDAWEANYMRSRGAYVWGRDARSLIVAKRPVF